MRVIARSTLMAFWNRHPRAETSLADWLSTTRSASWGGPADVRATFASADFIADNRVIFNVGGNRYRLVAHLKYQYGIVFVKFIGTHADYDRIDPETVG